MRGGWYGEDKDKTGACAFRHTGMAVSVALLRQAYARDPTPRTPGWDVPTQSRGKSGYKATAPGEAYVSDNDNDDDKQGDKPLTYRELERSTSPTLKAHVTGTGTSRVLTEEMLIQAAREIPIALQRMAAARHEMRAEWWPIIHWLHDQGRSSACYRLGMIVGMALEMGPPFVVNSAGYAFMQEMWKLHQEREK